MGFGVQTQFNLATIAIDTAYLSTEEGGESEAHEMPSNPSLSQGSLKTSSQAYTFTTKENPQFSKEGNKDASKPSLKSSANKAETASKKLSPENAATVSRSAFSSKSEAKLQTPFALASKTNEQKQAEPNLTKSRPSETLAKTPTSSKAQPGATAKSDAKHLQAASHTKNESRSENKSAKEGAFALSKQWAKEETQQWWEARYQEKEREGQGQGQKDRDSEQHQKEEEKGIKGVSASCSTGSVASSQQSSFNAQKPRLERPKVGVFALYFILTKIGITSDGSSSFAYKKEIESIDTETTELHKKRLDELQAAIKREKQSSGWGIALKVFSWIGSLFGMIAGVALIASGVGAVAGSMLIAASVIQVGSQIMEVTGGWRKIAELLPGDDTEKKRAILSWIQIGIGVLCLVLAGSGIIWGGFAAFGEGMQTAMSAVSGIASMGLGVCSIGEGIVNFFFNKHIAESRHYQLLLEKLKHKRHDMMENIQLGTDRLEQLFHDLAQALDFETELFQAEQSISRG